MQEYQIVDTENISKRLDIFLSEKFPKYSRSFFKELIESNNVTINGKITDKASYKVKLNDNIVVNFVAPKEMYGLPVDTEKMPIKVLFENPDFLIIFKPAGIIVHKTSAKSTEPTLVDWLIQHFKEIKKVGAEDRPGIVHRLDKDTSGLLIIPRNNPAMAYFSKLFKERKIEKTYLAIVKGHPDKTGVIDYNIVRDPSTKIKMKATLTHGRTALTNFEVIEYYENASLVKIKLITGRTHQIRVHFLAIGHPLIGDLIYGEPSKFIKRQALHAYRLSFDYNDQRFTFIYDIPQDMKNLIKNLIKKT